MGARSVRNWHFVKGLTLAKLLILNNFFQNGPLTGPVGAQ